MVDDGDDLVQLPAEQKLSLDDLSKEAINDPSLAKVVTEQERSSWTASWILMLSRELNCSFVFGVMAVYGLGQGIGGAINVVVVDYYWKAVQLAQPKDKQDPKLQLPEKLFLLRKAGPSPDAAASLKDDVFNACNADYMTGLYQSFWTEMGWEESIDNTLVEKFNKINEDELTKLDEKIQVVVDDLGESEVREALLNKGLYYIRIGDKEKALAQLKTTEAKTVAVGQKMDLVFYTLRLRFFDLDFDLIAKNIEKAKGLFDEGGD